MKRRLLGAIALIAFAAEAGAADLPLKTSADYAPYNWSGFYVGAHVGWEKADTAGFVNNNPANNPFFDLPDNGPTDQTMRGWFGGGQVGYKHQFGRAVIGVEFSGSWSSLNGQSASTTPGNFAVLGGTLIPLGCSQAINVAPVVGINVGVSCAAKADWSGQALTRLGYTFGDGRFLPYVEAGVAVTRLSIATVVSRSAPFTSLIETDVFGKSSEVVGVVLGGGAQYALGNGFSLGVEYLYARYPTEDLSTTGRFNCTAAGLFCPPFNTSSSFAHAVQENRDLVTNSARVVLNYKFAD